MIKTYPDRAAHDAAAKSEMESTVALIENVNKIVIDGVNVVTTQPKVGDIVCYDENRRLRFIELDSYREGILPAAWATLGVVVIRHGDDVTVVSKDRSTTGTAVKVLLLDITGYELDGEGHETTITIDGRANLPFTYAANTAEEFAVALQRFLTENGLDGWKSYVLDGAVKLQADDMEHLSSDTVSSPGLNVTSPLAIPDVSLHNNICRKGYGCSGVWNFRAAITFFREDNESSNYNPNRVIASFPVNPVCWPAFAGTSQYRDGDKCLWLRRQYCKDPAHPTEAEWEAYIDDMQIVPAMYGNNTPAHADGRVMTEQALGCEYLDDNGERRKVSRMAEFASTFMAGSGYVPSMIELIEAFGDCYEEADDVDTFHPAVKGLRRLGVSLQYLPGYKGSWQEMFCSISAGSINYALTSNGYLAMRPSYNYTNIIVWPFARINLRQDEHN